MSALQPLPRAESSLVRKDRYENKISLARCEPQQTLYLRVKTLLKVKIDQIRWDVQGYSVQCTACTGLGCTGLQCTVTACTGLGCTGLQ